MNLSSKPIVIGFLFSVLLFLTPGCSKKTTVQKLSNLEDKATFKLYIRELPIGTYENSIDSKGNYHRNFTVKLAGQTVSLTMDITPNETGDWQTIKMDNPIMGKVEVKRSGNQAKYRLKTRYVSSLIPDDDYVFFDDYGIVFESVMLKKYNLEKKGKQSFDRFRIPEQLKARGNHLQIEIELLGKKTKTIKGTAKEFMVFNYKWLGENFKYWVDNDYKIYLIHSKIYQTHIVREDYDELLPFVAAKSAVSKDKKTIMVPMRDGIKLSTNIYFPGGNIPGEKKYPLILIRTPYKKEMLEILALGWVKKGYICAIQDVRGRFASEGEWEPFMNEAQDGYDTIEYLAVQEWCTGKVGMIGSSYMGWVQLQTAVLKPPHLVTIIPNVAPADPFFNFPYEYGTFAAYTTLLWAEAVETEATTDISGKKLLKVLQGKDELAFQKLPVIDLDKKLLNKTNPHWRKWIKHNTNDNYWKRANYLDRLKNLEIPVFLQSGWFDGDGLGTKLSYMRLKKSKSKFVKMIVGPWGHTDQATTFLAEQDLGEEAGIDLYKLYHRWFDYWLKGKDNKILEEPAVQLYALNSNKWLKSGTYPLPGTRFVPLYFNSTKGANSLDGDGVLEFKQKDNEDSEKSFDQYIYNPGMPTPSPRYTMRKHGKKKYNEIFKSRKDMLVYQTQPTKKPVTFVGPMKAIIYASSSAKDTDWFVTVEAVQPDGKILHLSKGAFRARFRNSFSKPELLEENKVYKYTIDLWHTGITLQKGSRLRIQIASACFPYFSRNLNTGGNNETETKYISATQKIYHSDDYPSHILLPVIE